MDTYITTVPYTGDGVTTRWNFNFTGGYLSPQHIFIERDGVLTQAVLESPGTAVVSPAVPAGEPFTITRRTPVAAPLVNFSDGADLSEDNLDTVARQAVFSAAEGRDAADKAIVSAYALMASAEGILLSSGEAAAIAQSAANASETAQSVSQQARDQAVAAANTIGDTRQEILDNLAAPTGAAQVGTQPTGVGAVPRPLNERLNDIEHVRNRGVVGGGLVSETVALQRALNAAAGKTLVFENKDYLTGALVVPDNTTLITNGARFIDDGSGGDNSTVVVLSGKGILFDKIRVHVPAGQVIHRPVVVTGSNIYGDLIEVSADEQQANSNDNLDGAICIKGTGIGISNIKSSKFDFPVCISDSAHVTIGHYDLQDYVRGIFTKNSSYLFSDGASIRNRSPNASSSPGHNGLLIEGCVHLNFTGFIVEDAGEHGVRLGGAAFSFHINLNNFTVIRPGKCGIKVLPQEAFPARHVAINNAKITDCGFGSALGVNEEGLRLERVKNLTVNNCYVYLDQRPVSAYCGIRLSDVEFVTIDGARIEGAHLAGIEISSTINNDAGVPVSVSNNAVTIIAPSITGTLFDGILIDYSGSSIRYVNILGAQIISSGGWGINLVNSGGGSIPQPCRIDATVVNSVSGHYGGSGSIDYRIQRSIRNGDNPSLTWQEINGRLRFGTNNFKNNERLAFRFFANNGETGVDWIGFGNVVATHHRFYQNNTQLAGSITTNGTGTTFGTSSDYRLKVSYGPIQNALDRLTEIPVYRGEFKATPGEPIDYFIAHELAVHIPNAVTGQKDDVDEDGNPVYQSVDASKVVPLLVAAVQELSAKVAALQSAA